MQEFVTVSASSFEPSALASTLTEKSAEGWSVVGIVSTATEITAFLSREAGSAPAATAAPAAAVAAAPAAAAPEPSGWAVAPEPAPATASPAPMAPIVDPTPAASYQPTVQYQAQPAAQPAAQAIPANWYADPSGRFEMRYWDGTAWTAHVSRGGQQFSDPPTT